ncbi:MAG: Uncharacterized MFS-type transporter, partial [uncultured Corynebacteriales bacterium]
ACHGPGGGDRPPTVRPRARAAPGAAPARLPPAVRHPAGQPVRRRRLPGQPGRGRAVQPGERRGPGRHRRRVRRPAAAVLVRGAVRRGAAGPVAAAAGAGGGQPGPLPAGRAGRGGDRHRGERHPVLRDRPAGHLGQPVLPGRAVRGAAARGAADPAGHRERAVHHERLGGRRDRRRGGRGAAATDRRRLGRVRGDRAGLRRRLRLVGRAGPPVRPGPARPGRRRAVPAGDRRRRGPGPGRRRPARRRAPGGAVRAHRDRRAPVLLRHLDDHDPAALPELLHRRRLLPGRAGRAGPGLRGQRARHPDRRGDHPRRGPPVRQAPLGDRPVRHGRGDRAGAGAAVHHVDAAAGGVPARPGRPGVEDQRRHAGPGAGGRRLPRPGVLRLRHPVQRDVRGGGGGRGVRAAGERQVVRAGDRGGGGVRAHRAGLPDGGAPGGL